VGQNIGLALRTPL